MKKLESPLHPTPAIQVRADTMIFECISLMQDMNISSVLVVSADANEKLEGIFTERDLLKNFKFIQNYENLKLSIRTIMTSPVKTIDISDLDSAPTVMLKNGFRHLPVTLKDASGKSSVVGIVSMRDVLKRVLQGPPPVREEKKKYQLILFSQDQGFIQLVKKVCPSDADLVNVPNVVQLEQALSHSKIGLTENDSIKLLIDIEKVPLEQWAKAARSIHADPRTSGLVFVYNPVEKNPAVLDLLTKLNQGGKILVLSKPVNVLALSDFITPSLGEFSNLAKEHSKR